MLRRVPGLSAVSQAVTARARAAWSRDRARMPAVRAIGNRLFRMAILVGRGLVVHRLGMLAASLTFYTVFSIVPMLVVVLWTLKLFDHLPVPAELPAQAALGAGNQLLHQALGEVFAAVRRASEVTGIIGLVALLYVATKMFSFTERALYTIAGAGRQPPRLGRALGYVALFLMPPAVLGLSGMLLATARGPIGQQLQRIPDVVPGFDLGFAALLGFGVLWLAATLLYWAAVRARIPFASAAVGGLVSALALPVVFWIYADFQVSVAQSNALGSGFLAFPVFLMWSFTSWFTLLIGAEVAVAHHVDAVLVHGARAFQLDLAGERQASVAVLTRLTRAARAGVRPPGLSDDELARELRLPPQIVRNLCARLVDRGLLAEQGARFVLAFDPARTTVAELIQTVERDPTLGQAHWDLEDVGPEVTLAQLAAGAAGARA